MEIWDSFCKVPNMTCCQTQKRNTQCSSSSEEMWTRGKSWIWEAFVKQVSAKSVYVEAISHEGGSNVEDKRAVGEWGPHQLTVPFQSTEVSWWWGCFWNKKEISDLMCAWYKVLYTGQFFSLDTCVVDVIIIFVEYRNWKLCNRLNSSVNIKTLVNKSGFLLFNLPP